jgi:hypothetical protein
VSVTSPSVPVVYVDGQAGDGSDVSQFHTGPTWTASNAVHPNLVATPTVAEQRGPAARSGDTLAGECADATGPIKSRVILVYQSDIDDPANKGGLATCAASVAS